MIERKIHSLKKKMARIMFNDHNLSKYFWVIDINISCYIQSQVLIRPPLNKIPYDFWFIKFLDQIILFLTPRITMVNLIQNLMIVSS